MRCNDFLTHHRRSQNAHSQNVDTRGLFSLLPSLLSVTRIVDFHERIAADCAICKNSVAYSCDFDTPYVTYATIN